MAIETILRKRRALYRGEVGFFAAGEAFEEDLRVAPMDEDVICSFSSPKHIEQLRFLWALVHRVADNSNRWLGKDEAMEDLKLRAAYTKVVYDDRSKQLKLRPKSLKRASYETLITLTNRFIDIICKDVLPGMKPGKLKEAIEGMVGKEKAYDYRGAAGRRREKSHVDGAAEDKDLDCAEGRG